MSKEEKPELNPQDGKTENPEDVKSETSDVNEEKEIIKSEIPKSAIQMEVHHHPNIEKKNLREYFFEFIMIFIAVTLGFFAESYREHLKDNEEIHENIQSILADLESDVAHFNAIPDMNIYGYTAADSLISLLNTDISNTRQIYFYARAATANVGYYYTNSKTFDLLKASSMLKLIHPRKLLDSLGLYYVTFQLLTEQDDVVRVKNDAVHKGNYLLFDSYVFSHMKVVYDSINRSHTVVQPPQNHPALLSTDYKAINEVALNYYYLSASEKFDCIAAKQQKQLALRLIELIKQEYHLENE